MPTKADPRQNQMLAALPLDEFQRIKPLLEPIHLEEGDSLSEARELTQYIYFPTDSVVSLLCEMKDGGQTEVAVVGSEGVIGVSLFMGGINTPSRAMARNSGFIYRLKGPRLMAEFDRAGPLQDLLLRYTQALLTQMQQISVCNKHHCIDQQLCRWLLMSMDRMSATQIFMTHEKIAALLGVRREGISHSASMLQKSGLISYRRGVIAILERTGLEAKVCECYAIVKEEYERLMTYRRPPRDKGLKGATTRRIEAPRDESLKSTSLKT